MKTTLYKEDIPQLSWTILCQQLGVSDELKEIEVILPQKKETKYYLAGDEWVSLYGDDFNNVLEEAKEDNSFTLATHVMGEDPDHLLGQLDGCCGCVEITKEEYDQLKAIEDSEDVKYKTDHLQSSLHGFSDEQIHNILKILENVKDHVTKNYISFDTGGNFKHFFVQTNTGEWLGFHNNTGDITLSEIMTEERLEDDFLNDEGKISCKEQIKQNRDINEESFSDSQIRYNIINNILQ